MLKSTCENIVSSVKQHCRRKIHRTVLRKGSNKNRMNDCMKTLELISRVFWSICIIKNNIVLIKKKNVYCSEPVKEILS